MEFVQQIKQIKYEIALRVIGQDLVTFLIDSLEITAEREDFTVKGFRNDYITEAPQEGRKKTWRKLLSIGRRGGGVRHKLVHEPFTRKYTREDIKRLDEAEKLQRTEVPPIQDVLTLAALLRTIGRVVDSNGGRLIKLVKNQDNFTVEYEDANGIAHKDEHSTLSLYRIQQTEVTLREAKEKDPWSGVDR